MADVRAFRMIVRGRVQGVGFRWFAIEAAETAGVTGWVRNLPNGSVELWAEGRAEVLDAFAAAMRQGPRFGRVDSAERIDAEATGRFRGFEVRR